MLRKHIRRLAFEEGADQVGFALLDFPPEQEAPQERYQQWLQQGFHADMEYLERYPEVRKNPKLLLPNAQSIIVVAVSYYPQQLQPATAPQVAKYAYGKDYHKVLHRMLNSLAKRIGQEVAPHEYRVGVDTLPLHERYWAVQAGIGFVGKNRNLIIPGIGSYLFLGEILTSLSLPPLQPPMKKLCGTCQRCIEHCPTKAITPQGVDARQCLSYLTIEHRGEFPKHIPPLLGGRLYGCDTCMDVCPFNRTPRPTRLFPSSPAVLQLEYAQLSPFNQQRYLQLCAGTAMTRAKYTGMQRNINALLQGMGTNKND